ncbi:MAG TPA: deoxyribodipyrimidine photo-lyase [Longimicrobiales bacterium]|nr:deoxyribodipyrimidine photo-lyase [Longimicrobiales bacterium]
MTGLTRLVWHRGDLRTHDHAALAAAATEGAAVAGVVVPDPAILDGTSARRRALFHVNTEALRATYQRLGSVLVVRPGVPWTVVPELARELGAEGVHALRSYTPYGVIRDERTTEALQAAGVAMTWHDGLFVHAPGSLLTRAGGAFSVYTPYSRRWWDTAVAAPADAPTALRPPVLPARFDAGAVPDETADVPLPEPGEAAALRRLETFVEEKLDDYLEGRDRLDGRGTSRLSIDISLGTLSPRVAFYRVHARGGAAARKWLAELAWRDFMADLLWHRPWLAERPMDARLAALEWDDDEALIDAWQAGRTGIPVIDAGMRQLAATGWMSGRARMVTAQFLTKHLRQDWRRGEAHFRQMLLDGDAASNIGNWQWAAGLGVDNAPYFRVFNPVTQGRQHDPDGAWLRAWVPESGGNPQPLPHAVVDIAEARREYLAAMEAVR